jgi:hypothetical protein
MARTHAGIDEKLAGFLISQPVFFVATAPLGAGGHVNCSPKGNDGAFRVLSERQVAYRDLTGSGVETISHLYENGRIVLMFCAFSGPPRIVRLHGRGRVVLPGEPGSEELASWFAPVLGQRAIIVVDVHRVSTSCGDAVPLMSFERHRDGLERFAERKGADGLAVYRAEKNALSLDGLPGLPVP